MKTRRVSLMEVVSDNTILAPVTSDYAYLICKIVGRLQQAMDSDNNLTRKKYLLKVICELIAVKQSIDLEMFDKTVRDSIPN